MEGGDALGDTIVSNSAWQSFRPLGDTRSDRGMDTDGLGDTIGSNTTWQSFRPLKDTFSPERMARIAPSEDSLSECSTIPELTRTQEVALRSSKKLKSIGEHFEFDDDRTSLDANLIQTTSFEIDTDDTDSPGKRVSWPAENNLASTLRSNRDSSELIAASTREKTPRATGFTNKLMLRQSTVPGLESSKTFDSGNMQQDDDQEETTAKTHGDPDQTNVMTVVGSGSVDLDDIRPNTTASTENNLGKTTRGLLRDFSWDNPELGPTSASATETSAVRHEMTLEEQLDRVQEQIERAERSDKNIAPCYRKGLVFLSCIMIVIAAVVSVSVVASRSQEDDDIPHGKVFTLNVTNPCPDVSVQLGQAFTFTCIFTDVHKDKEKTQFSRSIIVTPPNRVAQGSFIVDHDGSGHWTVTGPSARCSSEGQYILSFVGFGRDNETVLHRVQIALDVNDDITNNVHTTITQQIQEGTDRTEFTVTTSVSSVCHNYAVGLVGFRNQKNVSLDANNRCNSSFTDFDGYSVDCFNKILDTDTAFNARYPVVQLSHGLIQEYSDVKLPPCRPMPACNATCIDSTNTTEDACNSVDVLNCFDPTLPVIYQSSVCKLGWCSAPDGMVLRDLALGVALCRDGTASTMMPTTTTAINYDEETNEPTTIR